MDPKLSDKIKEFDSFPDKVHYPAGFEGEIKLDILKLNDSAFKRMIMYYDSVTTSPIEFILSGTLATLSGAAGKHVYLKITDSLNIYMNIWAVIIGPSSISRKTTAINQCKKEFERISVKEYGDYKKKYAEYQKEVAEAKESKTKFDKPAPIRKYYIFPNDSTIESLSDILSCSDRGLIVHSEFGSLLQQLNRSYAGDSKQFLTHIYDVPESYEISRATRQNTLIQRPYVAILGASTIDWIKENSSPSDLRTGFLARFIYAIRNKPDPEKGNIPLLKLKYLTSRSLYYINTREIFDYLISIDSEDGFELSIDKKAEDLHCNYDQDSYKEMLECTNENELSFKARLIVTALKIAGIIALSERRNKITLKDMQDAIHLTEYYKANVERLLNSELSQTEFSRSEKKIQDIIKSKKGKIQHSILLQLSNMKTKELEEIIKNLIEKEIIEVVTEKSKYNKPVKFYKLK